MNSKQRLPREIQRLFREKQRRRQELARLPFEKKIQILLTLQKIAGGVGIGRRKRPYPVWQIHP